MSEGDQDWRLQGQENYLLGAEIRRADYKRPSAEWDHDHCEFCWATFTEPDYSDDPADLHEGYVANNGYHWICDACFQDFHERFKWQVIDARD
jgi:hypothetical protein